MHGNETFTKRLLIVGVESATEDSIARSLRYPTCVEQVIALWVELPLIVDNVGLISHALPGVCIGELD